MYNKGSNPGVQGHGNNSVKQGYTGPKAKSGGGFHKGDRSSHGTVTAQMPFSGNTR